MAEYRKRFGLVEKSPVGKAVLTQVSEVNRPAFKKIEHHLILKNYSPSTRKTYLVEFARLLYILKDVPVDSLSCDRLRAYFACCLHEQKMSTNHVHSRMNAVKYYYEQVLKQENFSYEIPRLNKH